MSLAHFTATICANGRLLRQVTPKSALGNPDRSRGLCSLRGDLQQRARRTQVMLSQNDFAGLNDQHGDLDKAERMWREAIAVFRDVGDTQGLAASSDLNCLAAPRHSPDAFQMCPRFPFPAFDFSHHSIPVPLHSPAHISHIADSPGRELQVPVLRNATDHLRSLVKQRAAARREVCVGPPRGPGEMRP